eukprot:scaffold6996_cov112-Isochrysis_galbana.AAC.6
MACTSRSKLARSPGRCSRLSAMRWPTWLPISAGTLLDRSSAVDRCMQIARKPVARPQLARDVVRNGARGGHPSALSFAFRTPRPQAVALRPLPA